MTKEEMAARLNGRAYTKEITKEEEQLATEAGLFVIFGASDDLMEVRGVMNDEFSCRRGGKWLIDKHGILPSWDDVQDDEIKAEQRFLRKQGAYTLKALWDNGEYSWTYETVLPHAVFGIMDEGEKYCRGIVISQEDM